jgi:DNA-binding response OmpR family regulator
LHSNATERKSVDLNAVAAEAVALAEAKTRQASVAVIITPTARPVFVEAVESQLLQILFNLLSNAIDAVSLGQSARRQVEVVVREPAEVLVADQGPGVPSSVLPHLFSCFYTTKAPGAGTGLGLYISRSLARANGALLEHIPAAAVGLTAGAVFRLRFASEQPALTGRPSVLVVDDETVVCELLTSLLEPDGIELHVALSGDQALRLLEKRRFDLVITDKNLPGVSGLEVARAVRSRYPDCPVMMMTGYASVESATEGLSLGLLDYIEKPFEDIGELRRRIREALRARLEAPVAGKSLPSRRVLIIEDQPGDAVKLGEAVTMAGGVPVIAGSISDALSRLATERPAGVILSLSIKDKALLPESVRKLRQGADGPLITLCEQPSLEQTVSAIRMGAAACLPRLLASPQALARELKHLLLFPKG